MGNHVVSSILQQLLQNRSLLPLMVAEEMQDAEYKNRQGAYRGREDPSSGGGGPVAELTANRLRRRSYFRTVRRSSSTGTLRSDGMHY
jgi:hypothetical protein